MVELGEKLLLARQEAGLSQRQLCGDVITRNMLSQIEHGTARPSMDTLRYLAGRLGKPMSYFLEEESIVSPNQALMEQARRAPAEDAWRILKDFQTPDPVLEWEWKYRSFAAALASAQQAREEGKLLLARQILDAAVEIDHGIPALERQRLLLLGSLPGADAKKIADALPSMDDELLLRAEAALTEQDAKRAAALLEAVQDRGEPRWYLISGRTWMEQRKYRKASEYLKKAEKNFPRECIPLLEECFRELGDFKRAYEYACRRR